MGDEVHMPVNTIVLSPITVFLITTVLLTVLLRGFEYVAQTVYSEKYEEQLSY